MNWAGTRDDTADKVVVRYISLIAKRDVAWYRIKRMMSTAKSAVVQSLEARYRKLMQIRRQGRMSERREKICQVASQQSNVERIHLLWRDCFSLIVRVVYRQLAIRCSTGRRAPASCDRDPLHGHASPPCGDIDAVDLCPRAAERRFRARRIVTAFRLGDGELREVGSARDPIRKITQSPAHDFDLSSAVENDRTPAQMREDGQTEISLEIRACDEASKETRQSDLDLTRLAKRFPKEKRRRNARRLKESIEKSPTTEGRAGCLQHLLNTSVFYFLDCEVDGRPKNRVCGRRIKRVDEGTTHTGDAHPFLLSMPWCLNFSQIVEVLGSLRG